MNKRQLVDKIAEEAHLTKSQAARALDVFCGSVQSSLLHGDRVTLMGFGSFALAERKARRVRDPRNGDTMSIEAHRVARFVPGAELKEAIERSDDHPGHSRASGRP